MFIQYVDTFIQYAASFFEIVGVAVVVLGGIQGIIFGITKEFKQAKIEEIERVRYIVGSKMLIGLEFFLAGDIISTAISPSWDQIGKLAALVAIRTVLSYFLHWETKGKKSFSGSVK